MSTQEVGRQSLEEAVDLALSVLTEPARTVEFAVGYVLNEMRSGRGRLSRSDITALKDLVTRYEELALERRCPTSTAQAAAVMSAGGIFVGRDELLFLSELSPGADIPLTI